MFPRIFHIYGPLWINSYGFMIAVGFLVFVFLMYKHIKKTKIISSNQFFNIIFVGLIGGIVGGRIFFLLTNWEDFVGNWPDFFYPWIGGFGILGVIIGVIVVVSFYLKINKIPILHILDIAAIYAPLFQSIARIGCFLAGCCYGIPVSNHFKLAVIFTNPHSLAPLNIPLHPTQIYLSLTSLFVFLIVFLFSKYFASKFGQILFTYLFLESLSRFTVDFWRGDRVLIACFSFLSYSQVTAFIIFVFALAGFIYVTKKCKISKKVIIR